MGMANRLQLIQPDGCLFYRPITATCGPTRNWKNRETIKPRRYPPTAFSPRTRSRVDPHTIPLFRAGGTSMVANLLTKH
jgi:hypothetical protein